MNQINKLDALLKQKEKLFHTADLALLWGIEDKNTLYTAIKRYLKKGFLISVHKGLYSTVPLAQLEKIKLGAAILHGFCYLSTESVLAENGIISQIVYPITFVASASRNFKAGGTEYISRQLNKKYLYQTSGIYEKDNVLRASVPRAIADLLYFNPKYHFDGYDRINWKEVEKIQKEVGYL